MRDKNVGESVRLIVTKIIFLYHDFEADRTKGFQLYVIAWKWLYFKTNDILNDFKRLTLLIDITENFMWGAEVGVWISQ